MSDFYLIRKNLTRNKLRLFLNSFAIFIAFMLFGMLATLKAVFDAGVAYSADDRLMTVNKINFTQTLPLAYVNKIRAVDGVVAASNASWFGGYYQDPWQQVVTFVVDPKRYLQVYDELLISDAERESWFNNRIGVLVGEQLAQTRGWQVGDRLPISSSIFFHANGSKTWDVEVSGTFRGTDAKQDSNYLLMHYNYFIETQTFGSDWIGWVVLKTVDPALNEKIAKTIDELFMNSSWETETTTEKQFSKAFIEQLGDIGFIITSVVMAAFFTILLIVGNSMALSVRERTSEIAVLKTLGFRAVRVFRLVLSESILLALFGGLLGLGCAWLMVGWAASVAQIRSMFPNLILGREIALQALLIMLLLGVVTGIFPAWRAMSLNTIDALNRR